MGAEPLSSLNLIGWRGVGLSWRALAIVVPHLPVLNGIVADLDGAA